MILKEMYGCAILPEENAMTTPHLYVHFIELYIYAFGKKKLSA
jgi:hypothetical protein